MENSVLVAVAGWVFPGAGHAIKKDYTKAAVIGAVIWGMFLIAILSGGAHYPGLKWEEGPLLYLLNVFARIGNVSGAVVSWIMNINPPVNVAELATFEYGGRFLEVAGLLNFLAVIDALGFSEGSEK